MLWRFNKHRGQLNYARGFVKFGATRVTGLCFQVSLSLHNNQFAPGVVNVTYAF